MSPRLPRRPSTPRPRGVSGAVAGAIARRREARATRVILRDRAGLPTVLDPEDDAAAQALVNASERLISAAQRGSHG